MRCSEDFRGRPRDASSGTPAPEDLLQRRPYNAVTDLIDTQVTRGRLLRRN
jgi:hypothetical protein